MDWQENGSLSFPVQLRFSTGPAEHAKTWRGFALSVLVGWFCLRCFVFPFFVVVGFFFLFFLFFGVGVCGCFWFGFFICFVVVFVWFWFCFCFLFFLSKESGFIFIPHPISLELTFFQVCISLEKPGKSHLQLEVQSAILQNILL